MSATVAVTLAAADLERERPNLERGSVVARGVAGLPLGSCCELSLTFPSGARLEVPARAVMVTGEGIIFAFEGHDRAALARCLAAPPVPVEPSVPFVPAPADEPEAPGSAGEPEELAEPGEPHPANVQERLRGLSIVEQLKVAREGSTTERIVLERLYGKVVWEALLRNARITVPEVMRLARMGTMPRPLLELVVGNQAWLQVPQIRRALLSNPRLSSDMVQKVLVLLPREELRLVPQVTAYPAAVRMAAKAMVAR